MQYLILGDEQGCCLALLGRLQQVALFGDFCLTPLIISVHMYMWIYDHFFNWIFMETLNKGASLKKQLHMSLLLRNSNNSCILQCRKNMSKTALCYIVNKEKDLWN